MEAGFFVKGFESRQFQLLKLHVSSRFLADYNAGMLAAECRVHA
jgi:hypothetical protein